MRGMPMNHPFADLPHRQQRCGHHLYVVEVSNGIVKVGQTHSPRHRVSSLTQMLRRKHDGATITRVECLAAPFGRLSIWGIELRLIERMREVAVPTGPNRCEYFTGIEFDAAVSLMREVIRECHQGRFSSLVSHGAKFCPREPLNTTQQMGVVL